MGITKTSLFTDQQNDFAVMSKVFSHPARLAIIQILINSNSCINSGLVKELGLAQATISQHLNELKSFGLIKGTVEGNSMNYCIDKEKWDECRSSYLDFFESYQCSNEHLCCE